MDFVNHVYDRGELGFIEEWAVESRDNLLNELQCANRVAFNGKNRYATIHESLSNPLFILNADNEIEHMNHAALLLFHQLSTPGTCCYGNKPETNALSWFNPLLDAFLSQDLGKRCSKLTLQRETGSDFLKSE